jgi:hypothetical protein
LASADPVLVEYDRDNGGMKDMGDVIDVDVTDASLGTP